MDKPSAGDLEIETANLYDFANRCTPAGLRIELWNILKRLFSFDSFGWTVAHDIKGTYEIEAWYGIGTRSETFHNWGRYRHREQLSRSLGDAVLKYVLWNPSIDEPSEEIMEQVYSPSGLGSTLIVQVPESPMRMHLFSLSRLAGHGPFEPHEAEMFTSFSPHIIAAFHQAWQRHAYGMDSPPLPPLAFCAADRSCRIVHLEGRCSELIRLEWPGWIGPSLPLSLQTFVSASREEDYEGQRIVGRIQRVAAGVYIGLRKKLPQDALTSEERRIAELYACDHPHEEIATLIGTTPAAVRTRLARIYRTLGVSNKKQLLSMFRPA